MTSTMAVTAQFPDEQTNEGAFKRQADVDWGEEGGTSEAAKMRAARLWTKTT